MKHGKNWSSHGFWDDDFKDDYYDDDDDDFFEDFQRKQFESFFRETNFRNPYSEDFYNEFYNINDNHQARVEIPHLFFQRVEFYY